MSSNNRVWRDSKLCNVWTMDKGRRKRFWLSTWIVKCVVHKTKIVVFTEHNNQWLMKNCVDIYDRRSLFGLHFDWFSQLRVYEDTWMLTWTWQLSVELRWDRRKVHRITIQTSVTIWWWVCGRQCNMIQIALLSTIPSGVIVLKGMFIMACLLCLSYFATIKDL